MSEVEGCGRGRAYTRGGEGGVVGCERAAAAHIRVIRRCDTTCRESYKS